MIYRRILLITITAFVIAGCASRANSVAPASVSAVEYANMSCEETTGALSDARERENALTRKQNNAATADTASVFLVLLPLGSVFGGDVAGELAEAKGEVGALERAVDINCESEDSEMSSS